LDHIFKLYHNDKLAFLATAVLFLFPLGMASVKSWASICFYLLVLICFFALKRQAKSSPRTAKLVAFGLILFLFCVLLSLLNSDDLHSAYKILGKLALLLLVIPLFAGLRALPIFLNVYLSWGLVLSGYIMGGVAFWSTFFHGRPRAMGYYHPIIFGNLSIVVSALAFCLLCSGIVRGRGRWLVVGSILAALSASLLSLSRGGWLAIPVLVLLYLTLYRDELGTKRIFAGSILLIFIVLLSPVLFPGTIGTQANRTIQSIEMFVSGEEQNTSLGARFLMWQAAVKIWQEHPVIGAGAGDFEYESQRLIDSGKSNLDQAWPHAHSMLFEYLSMTGLLGLITMILGIYAFPFYYFYSAWRKAREESGTTFPSLAGMSLIACYFVFGLSEVWLGRSVFITTFVLMLVVLAVSTEMYRDMKA